MTRPEALRWARLALSRGVEGSSFAEAAVVLSEPCVWTEDEDGIHHTACGEMFCFDGPIADHKQRFCGYCGAAIREVRHGA